MNRSERLVLLLVLVLLLLGLLVWRMVPVKGPAPSPEPEITPSTVTVSVPLPEPVKPKPKPSVPSATSPTGAPVPPKITLHTELIPKDIEIIRCYYAAEVAPPGTTFGFDLNGSGFTAAFEKMISLEAGHDHIRFKNLKLVTANQIHGEIEVGAQAKTGFVYPRVLIKGLPVFRAPEPFAVVRKGEVLTVFFTSMEENGRGGNFRVITHMDEALAESFKITASTPGIQVTELNAKLPYVMEGRMQIGPGVPPGEHGMAISMAGKEVFRRHGMIRIVRPNVGQMGFIQNLIVEERFRRPGDMVQIYVQGTGLSAQDITKLQAEVSGFEMGHGSFTYLSPLQLRLTMQIPANAPLKRYGVKILGETKNLLYEKNELFETVAGNWVAGVQVSPPLKAGAQSQLRIIGRDFKPDFAQSFKIMTDEPGLTLGALTLQSPSALIADISATAATAPGDYLLHLSAQGKKLTPPYGSIIKVESAQ